jgi:hypothetical protein
VPQALWASAAAGYRAVVEPTISRSVPVAADPATIWSMITDLPRMGDFSPENVGGVWVDGATGPAIGAKFRGTNRNGGKQWWTRVRVVACEPDRLFTFDVRTPFGVRVSRWSYRITRTDDGCVLTEQWYRVGSWVVRRFLGPRVTGRVDRPGYNVESIEYTLAAVKARAEGLAPGRGVAA